MTGVRFLAGLGEGLVLFATASTISDPHLASHPMGTGASRSEREFDYSPPYSIYI